MNRRKLLAAAPAMTALGCAGASAAAPGADADLIRVCQQFAEAEFAGWYLYVSTDDGEIQRRYENTPPDWAILRWIETTPAHTPAGWQAKALAQVAWDRDAYDNSPDRFDGHSALLASLMRDLAAPARAAIIARLVERYGPLPEGYTTDGVYVGRAAA